VRYIRKGREPRAWQEARLSTPGAHFDNEAKPDLRDALLAEQGYLCCYCMGRIDARTTRIEHFLPRRHKDDQLNYRNTLAACTGGEGYPPKLQHCDVRKGDRGIVANPCDPRIEKLVRYSSSGEVHSPDPRVQSNLNQGDDGEDGGALNLNLDNLKAQRRAVLAGFIAQFEKRHRGEWRAETLARELPKWAELPAGGGKLPPYGGIVADYIRRRIERARQGTSPPLSQRPRTRTRRPTAR